MVAKKKKSKKPPVKREEVKQEEREKEITEPPITCTCVGQRLSPAGAGFHGIVKSQRYVEKLDTLLLYFENGYCCNASVCKLVKEEK